MNTAKMTDKTHISPVYKGWLQALLLAAVTFIAYIPVWHAGFIWDDDKFLLNNPLIRMSDGLYRFWFTASAPDYFPATSTTLWLEWRLWGENPLGYHIVNVLLHALSSILCWRALERLKIPGAWLAAALFALHPVNVESVAWITERKNTLAMFFYAWTLLWYLRFEDTNRRLWYWMSAGAFVLALLSKSAVAPLPVVLLGIAWWRRGRVGLKDVWRTVPFFIASGILGLVTVWYQYHQSIGSAIVREDSLLSRLAGAGWAIWFYLFKALLPLNLIFVYPRWHIDDTNVLSYVPGLLVIAGFLLLWRFRRSWGKAWLFSLGYFVVMLLPVLGFLNIYFMRYSLVADHWQYFSIIGPIALVAAGVTMSLSRWEKRYSFFKPVLCGALLLALIVLTWRQSTMYTGIEALWRTTIARNPGSAMVHNNLGGLLLERGQTDEAIIHIKKALDLEPDHANAHDNMGNALRRRGQLDEAIAHYQSAIEIEPNHFKAHNHLGFALFQTGRVDEAIAHYRKSLQIYPGYGDAWNNLAYALQQTGRVDEAIPLYQTSLKLQPGNAPAHSNLARALAQKGRWTEAMEHQKTSVKLQPDNPFILYNYAWMLATCPEASVRNGALAIELANRANRLTGGRNPVILGTLAAAYAEAGRFPEAVTTAREAIELASAQSDIALVNALRVQIGHYNAGYPIRDSAQ
ncbi:MAG: tetratricopeptide repeat protein [Nitrospirae bacterium]|nr:tetratricopeptide repeat protein [Nitrospirota bacterium]